MNDPEIQVVTRSQKKQQIQNELIEEQTTEPRANPNLKIVQLTNDSEITRIIQDFHSNPAGGHQGVFRTAERLKRYYHFDNLYARIKKVIQSCELCQKNKCNKVNKVPMEITSTSYQPFEKIFLDIVGPLPLSHLENKYILTIQDDLTKFSMAFPLRNQEADTIARSFVEKLICTFGVPQQILSDQGANFMSELFSSVCKLLKIKKLNSSAYHPESNGALERSHRTWTEYLRIYTQSDEQSWDTWLPFAIFTFNTTPHTATKFMPYELLFGNKPFIPNSLLREPEIVYNYDDYLFELKSRLQNSFNLARQNLITQKQKSKVYYDSNAQHKNLNIGDLVLLKNELRRNKLSPLWLGPFEIKELPSPVNTTLLVNNKLKTVHNNRIKVFQT